jgi:hypothetical protein
LVSAQSQGARAEDRARGSRQVRTNPTMSKGLERTPFCPSSREANIRRYKKILENPPEPQLPRSGPWAHKIVNPTLSLPRSRSRYAPTSCRFCLSLVPCFYSLLKAAPNQVRAPGRLEGWVQAAAFELNDARRVGGMARAAHCADPLDKRGSVPFPSNQRNHTASAPVATRGLFPR